MPVVSRKKDAIPAFLIREHVMYVVVFNKGTGHTCSFNREISHVCGFNKGTGHVSDSYMYYATGFNKRQLDHVFVFSKGQAMPVVSVRGRPCLWFQ